MDLYIEQLYRKRKTPVEILLQLGIFLGCFAVTAGILFFFNIMSERLQSNLGSLFGLMLAVIFVFFSYKYQWFQYFDREFEYLYFNGDIDIDRITAKSTRKRLLSMKAANVTRFGIYRDAVKSNVPFDMVLDVTSGYNTGNQICFLVTRERNYGTVLLIFEPKEEILNDMKRRVQVPFEA